MIELYKKSLMGTHSKRISVDTSMIIALEDGPISGTLIYLSGGATIQVENTYDSIKKYFEKSKYPKPNPKPIGRV